jgi:hypothetical protein
MNGCMYPTVDATTQSLFLGFSPTFVSFRLFGHSGDAHSLALPFLGKSDTFSWKRLAVKLRE